MDQKGRPLGPAPKRIDRRDLLRRLAVLGALVTGAGVGATQAVQSFTQRRSSRKELTGMTDPARTSARRQPVHVVLLGDSSLDNAAYVPHGQAVIDHLHAALPDEWRASLLAVDGSRTEGVARQVARLPKDATHLVLSIGGNDALGFQGLLRESARSAADVIGRLADVEEEFAARYAAMLGPVLALQLPLTLCTIYNPNFPDPAVQRLATTAAAVFNDVILRSAFATGLPVIDFRLLFDSAGDYANAIEPSSAGGRKIARTIVQLLQQHDFARGRSEVFV